MKPITFPQANTTFAKDQKPYLPLPAYKDVDGRVITCWKANFRERLKFLFNGTIYSHTLTFNNPLQPHLLEIESPFLNSKGDV